MTVELGVASRALGENPECGDLHVVWPRPFGLVAGLIDGLGHGHEAAVAARAAARTIERWSGEDLGRIIERCHAALRSTRGVVLTLATFDTRTSSMVWAGIGNVDAIVLRRDRARREALATPGGVVGSHIPSIRSVRIPIAHGDVVVMATDGIRPSYRDGVALDDPPQTIADDILRDHQRGNDDASVLVLRYTGDEAAHRTVSVRDETDVVMARKAAREVGESIGLRDTATEELAAAVTEIAANIVVHARAGEIEIGEIVAPGRRGVVAVARDSGPGIADVDLALKDHFSTGNGLGLGLPAARRHVDDLRVDSDLGSGTTVTLIKWGRS